jgi:hypothetical protein
MEDLFSGFELLVDRNEEFSSLLMACGDSIDALGFRLNPDGSFADERDPFSDSDRDFLPFVPSHVEQRSEEIPSRGVPVYLHHHRPKASAHAIFMPFTSFESTERVVHEMRAYAELSTVGRS